MNKTSLYRTSNKKVKAEFATYHQPYCCFVVCLFVCFSSVPSRTTTVATCDWLSWEAETEKTRLFDSEL